MGLGCRSMCRQAPRRRILVVEDDRCVRELFALMLAKMFEVETLPDGTRGLERCCATSFDAVITDVRMPGVDGVAMAHALRAAGLRVPLLFVTGSPNDVGPARLATLQPARLLVKPCGFPELRAALADLGL